jgi:hypothetical protein
VCESQFYDAEFSTCAVILGLKKFQNLEHFIFWVFVLG